MLVVNIVLYFSFCFLAGTGLMLELRFEESGAAVFGMNGDEWSDVHEISAYAFIVMTTVHLGLHWAWLRRLAARHFWETALGLAAGVCLILVLLLAPGNSRSENSHSQNQEESCKKD
jgi:hypothetical protein